jgi:hypothetical protein
VVSHMGGDQAMDHTSAKFKRHHHPQRDGGFFEKLERVEDEIKYRVAHPKFIETDEELAREALIKKSRAER